MKLIIEQTHPDGKVSYIEKVATGCPDGRIAMTSGVFDDASWEQQCDVDDMEEGRDKLVASLRFADYCAECGEFDKAFSYYCSVLEKSISDGRIINECQDLAERAYQGVVVCNSCGEEYTWEMSSEILAGYKELFQNQTDRKE